MSYCPKCGSKVREEMKFCPKCGAPLKVEVAPPEAVSPPPYRAEKAEKREKEEKEERPEKMEKGERYEMRQFAWIGPFAGGLILIFVGLAFYLTLTASLRPETAGALLFVLIGVVIIVGAIYAATVATRRHPQT